MDVSDVACLVRGGGGEEERKMDVDDDYLVASS